MVILPSSSSTGESASHLFSFSFKFQRVKVYRLSNDGKWDDQGTGHVTVDYLEVWLFP